MQIFRGYTSIDSNIAHLFQVKISSQELETVNNRTERYNYRQQQQQQQHRQRQAPFSMSDKFSDILTSDFANTNSRKYQRPQTKRNSGGVEKNRHPESALKDEHVGRQPKITAASYSPAFAQHTLFSPSLETLKDRDLLMQDSPEIQSDDPFVKFRYEQFNFGKTESTTVSMDQQSRLEQKLEIIRKRQRKTLFRKSQKQMRSVSDNCF